MARIDMLHDYEPEITQKVVLHRGEVVVDGIFAYLLSPRAIWVKRVEAKLYEEGGMSIFNVPYESGRPKK